MLRFANTRLIVVVVLLAGAFATGCVSNQIYNASPDQYVTQLATEDADMTGVDLAIIEFDEFGMLWEPDQLESALALIEAKNAATDRGILLVTYTHGWMNNANPDDAHSGLERFRDSLLTLAADLRAEGAPAPDHVVGVYLGWRGATNRIPGWSTLSFWDRKATAERVASYQMRETLFRVTITAKQRPESKVLLSGHSMGGMILARTLAPTLATLLLASGTEGVVVPADLILLQNPALDGLAAFQLVEYLKRTAAQAQLRSSDGRFRPAPGPVIASITSEADWVTRIAFPAGQIVGNLPRAVRPSLGEGVPSQGAMLNSAHGHLDFLISHRAFLQDGEIVIEPVPDAYNTTPFWIISVTADLCRDHSDIYNPRFLELVEAITKLNALYDTDVETWIVPSP